MLIADTGEAWVWYNNGYTNFYAWLYAITSYPVFGMPKTVKIFRFGPANTLCGLMGLHSLRESISSEATLDRAC
jgi:hypothetical protein